MPYDSNEALPDSVQALPVGAQTIWREAFNAAYEEYDGDEEKAFATAWAAVQNTYEQSDGEWVRKAKRGNMSRPDKGLASAVGEGVLGALRKMGVLKDELPDEQLVSVMAAFATQPDMSEGGTVSIEFLRVGTFVDMRGREFTVSENDLDRIVANFELGAAGQDVPIDINHEYDEAAGWVKRVWRDGNVLMAEVEWTDLGVELVGSKRYRYVSAAVNIAEKVLRAISLVNFPAVSGLQPLTLSKPMGDEVVAFETGLLRKLRAVETAWYAVVETLEGGWGWIMDVYDDFLVICLERSNGKVEVYYRIAYSVGDDGSAVLVPQEEWERVEMGWTAASAPIGRLMSERAEDDDRISGLMPPRPITEASSHDDGGDKMADNDVKGTEGDVLAELVARGVLDDASVKKLRSDLKAESDKVLQDLIAEMKQDQARRMAEMLRQAKEESEISEFARKVTGTGANALPWHSDKVRDLLLRLSEQDRKDVMELMGLIHEKGVVDFTEYGLEGAPKHARSKKLSEPMAAVLHKHVADGGTIKEFFKENTIELGDMRDYDLREFEQTEE